MMSLFPLAIILYAPIRLKVPFDGTATSSRGTRCRVARAGAWVSSTFLPEEEGDLRSNIPNFTERCVVCLSYGERQAWGQEMVSEDNLLCRSWVLKVTFSGLYDVV